MDLHNAIYEASSVMMSSLWINGTQDLHESPSFGFGIEINHGFLQQCDCYGDVCHESIDPYKRTGGLKSMLYTSILIL